MRRERIDVPDLYRRIGELISDVKSLQTSISESDRRTDERLDGMARAVDAHGGRIDALETQRDRMAAFGVVARGAWALAGGLIVTIVGVLVRVLAGG